MKPNAVCVCIIKGDKVLAVARRGTTDQWGLPGGKVDPGESSVEALVRETEEEALITIDPDKCSPVFTRIDEAGYKVTTFLYDGQVTTEPQQGDAGPVDWVSWETLFEGPFGQYNHQLYEVLQRKSDGESI